MELPASFELIDHCKVQQIGNSYYLLIPAELVQKLKIEKSDPFRIFFDQKAKAVLYAAREAVA